MAKKDAEKGALEMDNIGLSRWGGQPSDLASSRSRSRLFSSHSSHNINTEAPLSRTSSSESSGAPEPSSFASSSSPSRTLPHPASNVSLAGADVQSSSSSPPSSIPASPSQAPPGFRPAKDGTHPFILFFLQCFFY